MTRAYFNWSGGKDSALALWKVLKEKKFEIEYLLTSMNSFHDRISMHGVRRDLLEAQASSLNIPLTTIELPEESSMAEYETAIMNKVNHFKEKDITHSIFGDIFLEDLRNYRDARLAEVGMTGIYPLWKRDTTELIDEFFDLGFETVIACTQERLERIVGKEITPELILSLPEDVDVCGENGEFHTFAFKGPIFKNEIKYKTGGRVFKEYAAPKNPDDTCFSTAPQKPAGFWYCDLLPA